MKKVFAILLVSVFAFAMVACGDDDDGSSFDNVAACTDLQDTMNALECVTTDFDLMCDSYEGYETCDFSGYYDCMQDVYTCEGDPSILTYDLDALTECTDILTELSDTCNAA